MKTFVLFAVCCVFAGSLFSQITITSNDLPRPGKIYVVNYDTVTQVNIGGTGQQTWNFSQLNNHYYKLASYSPTAPYQYWAPEFPGSNIYTYGPSYMFAGLFGGAPVDESMWGYAFWKTDNTGLRIVGWRGDYGLGMRNVQETQQELLMGTPATYNSVFNNNSQWTVFVDVIPSDQDTAYQVKTKKTLTSDAYGSLTTPYGTFNVIRVHEFYTEIDSSFATLNGQPLPYPGIVINKDTLHNYYFWANGIGYPVATIHADSNNVVKDVEYLDTVYNTYSIHGQVHAHNNSSPVTQGSATLMGRDAIDHLFGIDEEIPLDGSGHFQFANVLGGNWMVRALPDTGAFAAEMPTYYGNEVLWNTASILSVSRDTNITILCTGTDSLFANNSGSGQLSGIVYADTANMKSSFVAAEDITVILVKGDSMYYAKHGKTDHLGNFHFKNLPNSTYRIKIEIAGVTQDSTYEVQLSGGTLTGLNFYYDDSTVHLMNGSGVPVVRSYGDRHITVYPNPLTDKTTILFTGNSEKEVFYSVSVFDVTGKEMFIKQGKTSERIELDCSGLRDGIYFFSLLLDRTTVSRGKLIVK